MAEIPITLDKISTDDLKAEIRRRQDLESTEYWAKRIREAKYLCSACGMPDSHHTHDCPTDTDCT